MKAVINCLVVIHAKKRKKLLRKYIHPLQDMLVSDIRVSRAGYREMKYEIRKSEKGLWWVGFG